MLKILFSLGCHLVLIFLIFIFIFQKSDNKFEYEYILAILFFLHGFMTGYVSFKIKEKSDGINKGYDSIYHLIANCVFIFVFLKFIDKNYSEWIRTYLPLVFLCGYIISPYFLVYTVRGLVGRCSKR